MKQKSQKQLQAEVDKFNENFPIGSKVKLKKDSGQIQEVTVESEASILGGHSAVGWFEEISGCYDLGRVIY